MSIGNFLWLNSGFPTGHQYWGGGLVPRLGGNTLKLCVNVNLLTNTGADKMSPPKRSSDLIFSHYNIFSCMKFCDFANF